MNTTETIKKHSLLLGIVAVVLLSIAISAYVVKERLEDLTSVTKVQLAEQKTLLLTIAETTARNGADSVTELIVRDCPIDDRSRFDILLGNLNSGLSAAELNELEQLFGVCGGFYAERKAVMVSRLARETEIYESYVRQLEVLTGKDESTEQQLEEWKTLVEGEQTQSVLFTEMVRSQKEIIDALIEGNSSDSEEIANILNEVRETREALLLTKTQTDELRSELTAL